MMGARKTVIVGAGQTGLSCLRFLTSTTDDELTFIDTRDHPPRLDECRVNYPSVRIYTGALPEAILLQADRIVISPGLALTDPVWQTIKQAKIPIIGDVELFVHVAKAPIIAVTGSNGKGTVITWLKTICDAANQSAIACGNIGLPVLDALLDQDIPQWYLVELSSFQLLSTYSLKAHSAIVLNISDDHLDYHGTMEAYQAAKHRIYHDCQHPVINRDDPRAFPMAFTHPSLKGIGLAPPQSEEDYGIITYDDEIWLAKGEKAIFDTRALRVVGSHNWSNALAVMALADTMKLPFDALLQGLNTFDGLDHRCQWIADHHGVTIYNDSKGTNVGATMAAISAVGQRLNGSGKIILLMGGQGKGADFSILMELILRFVKQIYVFGQDALIIQKTFEDHVNVTVVSSLKEAVDYAIEQAQSGDSVLLSPACASYDMFSGFADRGRQFTHCVLDKLAQ